MTAPVIGITMGDPAGIGPEVILRALAEKGMRRRTTAVLFGDPEVFRETARRLGLSARFTEWSPTGLPDAARRRVDTGQRRSGVSPLQSSRRPSASSPIAICATASLAARERIPGRPTVAGAQAAYDAILAAVAAVGQGHTAAIVTAPISKAHLAAAGHPIPGHTELLARLAGGRTVRMMMAAPTLRVVLATTHVPLRRVPALLTTELVRDTIALADRALRQQFRLRHPRLAVCGLNPHAGENGLFGDEDTRVVGAAIAAARRKGADATGPWPADSIFARAVKGDYDAVVCMYHDQGLAPFKLLHFDDGVNVTLGLPFVRTSPDHGTAFDIAGRGRASAGSMAAAIRLAAELSARRRRISR